jgi:hypothetical protein
MVIASALAAGPIGQHAVASFSSVLNSDRNSVYGALVGLHGALLGFGIAAMTIVIGFGQSKSFKAVRGTGFLQKLYGIFLAMVVSEGLAVVWALIGLAAHVPGYWGRAIGSVIVLSTGLSLFRFARVMWVTWRVVRIVAN